MFSGIPTTQHKDQLTEEGLLKKIENCETFGEVKI